MRRLSDTQPIPTLPAAMPGPAPAAPPWAARRTPRPKPPLTKTRRHRPLGVELRRWLVAAFALLAIAVPLLGLSLVAAIYWQARTDQTRPVEAIVVLGTAQFNGHPGPVLRARLDRTRAVYEQGTAPLVVVTGGRQPGDQFTEAEASRDYLIERGIPSGAILLENAGSDSWDSMQSVAALLDERGVSRVLLVSDGFHLFRVKLMARDLGLTPYATAAPDSPIREGGPSEFSYVLREAAGVFAHLWQTRR